MSKLLVSTTVFMKRVKLQSYSYERTNLLVNKSKVRRNFWCNI